MRYIGYTVIGTLIALDVLIVLPIFLVIELAKALGYHVKHHITKRIQ